MSGSSIDLEVSQQFLDKAMETGILFEERLPEVSACFHTLSQEMERLIKAVLEERQRLAAADEVAMQLEGTLKAERIKFDRQTSALEQADRRYRYMRAWYVRGGTRQEVYSYCHIMKPTASMVDQGIDEACAKAQARGKQLATHFDTPYEQNEEG